MPQSYRHTYRIDTRDLDCFDRCRPGAVLGYLQDVAGLAAEDFGGANPQMIAKYRHCWMIARMQFTLKRPLRLHDALELHTWHRGGDGAVMYRDTDLIVDGEAVGEALAAWVLADLDTRALARMSAFPELQGTDGGALNRATRLRALRLPGDLPEVERRALHYSDLDANSHVNNTRYADFLCDALALQTAPKNAFVSKVQLNYLKECRAGETLLLKAGWQGDDGLVSGEGTDGEVRFTGALTLSKSFP